MTKKTSSKSLHSYGNETRSGVYNERVSSFDKYTAKIYRLFIYKKYALVVIIIIGIIVRIPLIGTEYLRTPDSLEYINVAQNIANGRGLIQSIKWQYFDYNPVITSAFHGRPIGTALIFALILKIGKDNLYLQVFSLLMGVGSAMLFYFLALKLLSRIFAFMGSVLVVLNPNILIFGRSPLSEHIFVFLVLLVLVVYFYYKNSLFKFTIIGVLCGISYYVRNEGLIVAMTLIFFISKNYLYRISFLSALFLSVLPLFIANVLINNSPFYSYNYFHFSVRNFIDGMTNYNLSFPSATKFMKENAYWISKQITSSTMDLWKSIFDIRSLGLFSLLALFSLKDVQKFPQKMFIIISVAIVFSYSILWSAVFEGPRHFPLVFILLLLVSLMTIRTYKLQRVGTVLFLITLTFYLAFDIHRIIWARGEIENQKELLKTNSKVFEWMKKNISQKSIVVASNARVINYYTGIPSAQLPYNISNVKLYNKFVSQFTICYFIINREEEKYLPGQILKSVYANENVTVYKTKQCDGWGNRN